MSVSEFIKALKEDQIQFICEEFSVSEDSLSNMTREQIGDLYEKLCEIEIEEAIKADNNGEEISPRGEMAADIVTAWGNMLWEDDPEE